MADCLESKRGPVSVAVGGDLENQINEEYKIWKKNTPFLYDLILTHPLEWPSLTVQWTGHREPYFFDSFSLSFLRTEYPGYYKMGLILGTQTAENEQNYLHIASVQLPNANTEFDARMYEQENGEYGGFAGNSRVDVVRSFRHDGDVHRARQMPQSENVIATLTENGCVSVFDTSSPSDAAVLWCKGLSSEGFGLCWSPHDKGVLAAATYDCKICLWTVDSSFSVGAIAASTMLASHSAAVEDVAWHGSQRMLLGSVGRDRSLFLWDLRRAISSPTTRVLNAHASDINALSFHPNNEFNLLTGSSDRSIALWDLRNLTAPIHSMADHSDAVMAVSWNPTVPSIFASASADRRIHVYDTSRIGAAQSAIEAEDGPPELLFIHGGHTNRVSDLDWNPEDPWVIASSAEDGILQIWQIAENIRSDTFAAAVLHKVEQTHKERRKAVAAAPPPQPSPPVASSPASSSSDSP